MPRVYINAEGKVISQELYDLLINATAQELQEWLHYKKRKLAAASSLGEISVYQDQSLELEGTPSYADPNVTPKLLRFFIGSIHSSLQVVTANLIKGILLRSEITNNKIKIITNKGQRADTGISGSQGDHVTAYITLLQAICSIVDGEDVHEASQMLYDVTKCFFGDEAGQKIRLKSLNGNEDVSFEEKLRQVKKLFFPRDIRKNLTKNLRVIRNYSAEISSITIPGLQQAVQGLIKQDENLLDVDQLRDCLKRSNQTIFAQLIVELGEKVLEIYNQLPTAAFPKLKINKEGSSEGSRLKGAMKELRLLNKLIEITIELDNTKDHNEKLTLVSNFIGECENVIKTSNPNIVLDATINGNFQKFLQKTFNDPNINIELKKITLDELQKISLNNIYSNQLGICFNNLFDFKQKNIIKTRADQPDGLVVIDGNEAKIALKDPINTLCEVTARHINFMFIAFKHLKKLSSKLKKARLDGFIEKIIASSSDPKKDNSQGWGEYSIPGSFGDPDTKFTSQGLSDGIKELCAEYKGSITQDVKPQLTFNL